MSAPVRRTSRICAPRTAAILLSSSAPGTMCVITIDRAAGMCIGEPSAFHRPLVPLGNCARHLPMVLIGTGIQGVSQLNVYLLKELKSLRVLSASTSCASHSTHRPPKLGVTAMMGTALVRTAACSLTASSAAGTAALLTIFHNRAIASMHGRHNLWSRSRSPELHNSHCITTFLNLPENCFRSGFPAALDSALRAPFVRR